MKSVWAGLKGLYAQSSDVVHRRRNLTCNTPLDPLRAENPEFTVSMDI